VAGDRPGHAEAHGGSKTAYDVQREARPHVPGLPEGALPDVVRPGTRPDGDTAQS
jgi:hypothetical protein